MEDLMLLQKTCAYGNTEDQIKSNERWNDYVDEQQEKGITEKELGQT